jgi:uncharacterized RDD family membrane protein YckC
MAERITITTPEGVQIEYRLAGVGSRFVATLIDSVLQGLLALVVVLVLAVVSTPLDQMSRVYAWAFGAICLFLLMDGYYVLFETIWNGQSPGKRMCGLRVIRDGGHPVDFRAVLIRNLLRTVDALPGMYALGVGFILLHPQNRRLGDIAAGTLVVREREEEAPTYGGVGGTFQEAGVQTFHAPSPLDDIPLPIEALGSEHYDLIETFMRRRLQLEPGLRRTMGEQIAGQIRGAMSLGANPPGFSAEKLLEEVLRRRARRAGL